MEAMEGRPVEDAQAGEAVEESPMEAVEGSPVEDAEATGGQLEDAAPWGGPAGVLRGPHVWRCPRTGGEVRYFAARVAPAGDELGACGPPEDEPVVLYFSGLGDAGGDAKAPFAKRLEAMMSWRLAPFLFLAPLRPPGQWWVLDGDEPNYGYLGELVPETVDLLAAFVGSLADDRRVVALGFSAGAYCITELLARGSLHMDAVALGGLHGHGQPDVEDVPKKRKAGTVEKFQAYLNRLGGHSGVPGGILAMHAEDDGWCPRRYAEEALGALGDRNAQLDLPRVQYTLLPAGTAGKKLRGHSYEDRALWRQELLRALLSTARKGGSEGRPAKRRRAPLPRGSVVLTMPDGAGDVPDRVAGGAAGVPGATCCWLPGSGGGPRGAVLDDPAGSPEQRGAAPQALWEELWEDSEPEDREEVQAEPNAQDGRKPEWATRAAEILNGAPGFKEHGFVILLDALAHEKAARVLADCHAVARQMVSDTRPRGNRHGGGRYSFGTASSTGSMLHIAAPGPLQPADWRDVDTSPARRIPSFATCLLNNWAVLATVEAIFELRPSAPPGRPGGAPPPGFRCVSGGGDFVLAGERRFQLMHNDLGSVKREDDEHLPPPLVSVNFCVEDITGENGPMRMVPGTQRSNGHWAGSPVEQADWRASRLFPLPAGAAIVRDVRTLHAGSPNFSGRPRFLPAVEFTSLRFLGTPKGSGYVRQASMPRALFLRLRRATRRRVDPRVVARGPVVAGFKRG
ncbi:unnamed protein product [Prorocentrum cordatum]|uniref:Uncharacterized protein n=1 Tax=Prorocentrum cordatum TaxID=2364126 RepID=A0ABN9VZ16_9DINO|nr:unnamed protein product [Polarella glacialis]